LLSGHQFTSGGGGRGCSSKFSFPSFHSGGSSGQE